MSKGDSSNASVESVGRINRSNPKAVNRVLAFERGQLAFLNAKDDWLTAQHPLQLRDWA